jgi:hypothetical protein
MSQNISIGIRLTAIASLLAAVALAAGCGGGGGEASASEAGATQSSGSTTTVASAVPSGAAFACDFSSGWQQCGFMEQAKVTGQRATIVSIGGVNAVRLHTEPGDNNVTGSGDHERNDLTTSQATTDGYEGSEHWWAHSVLFPDDYVDPPQSELGGTWHAGLVFDFHNTTDGGAVQANFQVQAMPVTAIDPGRPTGLSFQVAYGNPSSPTKQTFPIGPVVRNVWYNFKYHVRWASDGTGFFKAWVNDVPYMDYKGPTLYSGQGVYVKLANYHSPYGQPSSVIHARVIRSNTPL